MSNLAENWPYPKKRGNRAIRPEDKGLPEEFRRCLAPEHTGVEVLPIESFPKHPTSRKGRRFICENCFQIRRKCQRNKYATREEVNQSKKWDRPLLRTMQQHGYYEILSDPLNLFQGMFRKYDFALSFDGQVWTEGTRIRDETGNKFTLQYEPIPGLIRDDGAMFKFIRHEINRMGFQERSDPTAESQMVMFE